MKVYFETFGCSYNFSDSEYMKSIIYNYEPSSIEDAEVIVLNTCTVKNKTIANFKKKLDSVKQINPKAKVVIAGCMTLASKKSTFEIDAMKNYAMIGPNNLDDITDVITASTPLHKLDEKGTKENRIHTKIHDVIEIVPISKGCLNVCTYCQTKLARGDLQSFRPQDIEDRVRDAVTAGSKIIYLTSQDNGCYGFDIDTNLAELLKRLVAIEGDFKIRIGMANPQHTVKIIDELVAVMKHPKIFKFLHIPAQSGSDAVLKHMLRGNKTKHVLQIAETARKEIPEMTLATDIIVGYPSETEEDFKQTLQLLETVKFDVVNRAKFSPRPGTKAATMKKVPNAVVSRRSKELDETVRNLSFQKNKAWVSWSGNAIVESNKKEGTSVLRNEFYKPIVVQGEFEKGRSMDVTINDSTIFHLVGKSV